MKLFNTLLAALLLFSCAPEKKESISITGKVQFPDNRFDMKIYKRNGGDKICVDSVKLNPDGTYAFEMKITEPGVYSLDCQKWQSVQFWAEDEDLEINFRGQDTAKIKVKNPPFVYVKGGPNNEVMNLIAFNSYRNYQNMIIAGKSIWAASQSGSKEWQKAAGNRYNECYEDMEARTKYIAEHYAERHSILHVLKRLSEKRDAELIEKVIQKFEAANPNYKPFETYKKDRAEAKALREKMKIGKIAPEFEFPNEDGKMVKLSDFRGDYLLIDFWASWCGPCRKEIPHVVDVYNKYKEKGLQVLSVSVDKSEKAWRKALSEENMEWEQLLAPEAGKHIMKEYQFSGIPFIILLDKDGKIVAKQLRGEKLKNKMEEIFSK